MRRPAIAIAIVIALLAAAAPAHANVTITSELLSSNPVLASGEVVWSRPGAQVAASPFDGPIRTLPISTGGDPNVSGSYPLGAPGRFGFESVDRTITDNRYMVVNAIGSSLHL